ncbi:hypothetical protein [Kribbella antibiotica]|nr:hypothetical protein [Kribbella antibiotica]
MLVPSDLRGAGPGTCDVLAGAGHDAGEVVGGPGVSTNGASVGGG